MKRRTRIAIIVLPLFLILLVTYVIYFKPLHYSGSYTACTIDGDTVSVEFDMILYRGLWNKDRMTGSIFVDGSEYVSLWDLTHGSGSSIPVEDLANGSPSVFYHSADTYMGSVQGDCVYLYMERNRLDNFMIGVAKRLDEISSDPTVANASTQNGEYETHLYFGPAASQAEAEEIWSEYYK